jgi:hypothetical protein
MVCHILTSFNTCNPGLENRDYGCGDPLRWPRDTLYQLKLALTSPAGCGHSVGIVCLRTKTTEFSLVQYMQLYGNAHLWVLQINLWMHFLYVFFLMKDLSKKVQYWIIYYVARVTNLDLNVKISEKAQFLHTVVLITKFTDCTNESSYWSQTKVTVCSFYSIDMFPSLFFSTCWSCQYEKYVNTGWWKNSLH